MSEYLRELWPFGRNGIGEVTPDSCMYVAGYVTEKLSPGHDDKSRGLYEAKYGRLDNDGRFYLLQREFSNMSRRPGIGRPWFDKFGVETYRDDSVVVSGVAVRPPRYFDNLFEEVDGVKLKDVKRKRKRRALAKLSGVDACDLSRRGHVRERIVRDRLSSRRKDVS